VIAIRSLHVLVLAFAAAHVPLVQLHHLARARAHCFPIQCNNQQARQRDPIVEAIVAGRASVKSMASSVHCPAQAHRELTAARTMQEQAADPNARPRGDNFYRWWKRLVQPSYVSNPYAGSLWANWAQVLCPDRIFTPTHPISTSSGQRKMERKQQDAPSYPKTGSDRAKNL
jgi:hypothetical protein